MQQRLIASKLKRAFGDSFELLVDHVSVAAGEVLCILGPTGAGKSTLLKLLAGLDPGGQGHVQCSMPEDADRLPLALVPQRPILVSGTVRYNLELGLRFRGTEPQQRAERVARVAERLELTSMLDRSVRGLSGGETRLVALGRALVLEPAVLLVDEPTADLDPGRGALVERALLEEARQRATAVIWTTHNLFQARRVANQVMLLCAGRVVEQAPVEQFFNSPRDPLTRRFLAGELLY